MNPEPDAFRRLDHRSRIVLGLFARQETITAALAAVTLGLSDRMAQNLMQKWVEQGWLEVSDIARKTRAYRLSAIYRQYIGSLSAIPAAKKK